MVTGASQEEVMIFRYRQTELHHNIYITIIIIKIIKIIKIIIISQSQTLIQDPCRTVVPKDLRRWFGPSRPVKHSFHFFNARLCQGLLILV